MSDSKPTQVLVVEDNEIDADLLRMAFEHVSDWRVQMTLVQDGEEAMRLLQKHAADPRDQPDFVILDLNLPRRDGVEILHFIRSTEAIASLPVAIFSSSPDDVIKRKVAAAGVVANGHFTKPLDFDEFLLLGQVLRRWLDSQLQSSDHRPKTKP